VICYIYNKVLLTPGLTVMIYIGVYGV